MRVDNHGYLLIRCLNIHDLLGLANLIAGAIFQDCAEHILLERLSGAPAPRIGIGGVGDRLDDLFVILQLVTNIESFSILRRVFHYHNLKLTSSRNIAIDIDRTTD